MKLNRIINLLKYDWTLYSRKAFMILGVFSGIFFICALVSILFNFFTANSPEAITFLLPIKMAIFLANFQKYANIILAMLVTVVLHHKFTNARTATNYLALPGTSLEKLIVLCLDYLIVYLASNIISWVLIYPIVGIGALLAPEANWMALITGNMEDTINLAFNYISYTTNNSPIFSDPQSDFSQMLLSFIKDMQWFSFFDTASSCLLYMVLNMCFKKNGQLKAIGCEVIIDIVVIIAFIIHVSFYLVNIKDSFVSPGDVSANTVNSAAMAFVLHIFNLGKIYFYSTPICCAALLGILYMQIKKKQAF